MPGAKTLEFAKPAAPQPEPAAAASSRVLERGGLGGGQLLAEGPLSGLLRDGAASGAWEPLAARLRAAGPSAVDADIRLLSPERDGRELRQFVEFLLWMLEARREFDLVQGYMSSLLNAHGDLLSSQPLLKAALGRLAVVQAAVWREVNELFQRNECLCSLLTRIEPF